MDSNKPRWRYFYDGQSPAKAILETNFSKEAAQQNNPIAHSVHTFSHPLSPKNPPPKAWGDLHLMWEDSTPDFHPRRIHIAKIYIERFLNLYAIPKDLIKYYVNCFGVRVVVPAYCFCGDHEYRGRLKNEAEIMKRFSCRAAPDSRQWIPKRRVPFIPCEGLCAPGSHPRGHKQVSPGYFWENDQIDYYSCHHDPCDTISQSISCLARVFTLPDSHRKDHILGCSVLWNGLQHTERISDQELALLYAILGKNNEACQYLATKGGKLNRPDQAMLKRLKGIQNTSNNRRFPFCKEIQQQLQAGSLLTCKLSCGVTTPVALQYKAISWHEGPFGDPNDRFECTSAGVYVNNTAPQSKELLLPRPVWISAVSPKGGRRLSFVDMAGIEQETFIMKEDLESHVIFKRLEDNGLILPLAPKRRHAIRAYLKSRYWDCDSSERFRLIPALGWNHIEKKEVYVTSGRETFPKVNLAVAISTCNVPPLTPYSGHPGQGNRLCDLLIVSLEVMAMFLKPLGFEQGVCCHFFTPTEEAPQADYEMAFRNGYTPQEAHPLLPELAKIYQDGAARFIALNEKESPALRRLVNRYLLGRKNGGEAIRGVMLSTGKESFTETSGIISKYCQRNKLLAVCIAMGPTIFEQFPFNYPSAYRTDAITALTNDTPTAVQHVQARYEAYKNQAKHPKAVWGKHVAAFFALAASIADWSHEKGVIRWKAHGTPGKVIINFFRDWYRVDPVFDTCLKSLLAVPYNAPYQEAKEVFILSPENPKLLLATSPCLKRLMPSAVQRSAFVDWLKKNKIMIRDSKNLITVVRHIPEINKSRRGYLLRIDAMKSLLERTRLTARDYVHPIFR